MLFGVEKMSNNIEKWYIKHEKMTTKQAIIIIAIIAACFIGVALVNYFNSWV